MRERERDYLAQKRNQIKTLKSHYNRGQNEEENINGITMLAERHLAKKWVFNPQVLNLI